MLGFDVTFLLGKKRLNSRTTNGIGNWETNWKQTT